MNKFNKLKLKTYLIQLLIGLSGVIIGIQLLYSILSEMKEVYDISSRYAYISGIIICLILIAAGILFILKAFHFDKQLFKDMTNEEKNAFLEELDEQTTLSFGTDLIVTKHFLIVRAKHRGAIFRLIKIENLIACFGRPFYAGSDELVQYDIILCDKDFKMSVCEVKDENVSMMEKAFHTICSLAPWVLSEDYVGFLSNYRKKARQKAYLKMIEHRREQMEIDEDTIPEVLISAADLIQAFEAEKHQKEEDAINKSRKKRKLKIHKRRN